MKQMDDWGVQALAAQNRGDLKRAESLYRQALQINPVDEITLQRLSALYLETGDAVSAADCLQRWLALRPDSATAHRELGRAWQALGQSEEALASLYHALDLVPDDGETNFYLGCLLQRQGRVTEAVICFRRAVEIMPASAEAQNNLGTALAVLGQLEEAISYFRKALKLRPAYPDASRNLSAAQRLAGENVTGTATAGKAAPALSSLAADRIQLNTAPKISSKGSVAAGLRHPAISHPVNSRQNLQRARQLQQIFDKACALQQRGDLEGAKAAFLEALEMQPVFPEAYSNLGLVYYAQGSYREAETHLRQAIAQNPEMAGVHSNLGNALTLQGRFEEAETSFRRAIELDPNFPDAWSNLGNALQGMNRPAEAEAAFRHALALNPKYAEAYNNLSTNLMKANRLEEAADASRKAIELKPTFAPAYSNYGSLLTMLGDYEQGEAILRQALALDPHFAASYSNLGNRINLEGRFEDAEACYRQAIALQNNEPDYHKNLSFILLGRGEFEEGLEQYEWRADARAVRGGSQPRWNGEPLEGRTLLVSVEQGMGDTIQFARYLPLLKTQAGAGRVIFECYPELTELLKECPGIDEMIVWKSGPLPTEATYDAYIQMMSLPRLLKTRLDTIPAQVPYLRCDPQRTAEWGERLRDTAGIKAGIVWAGNPTYINDRIRSCHFSDFAPLLAVEGVTLFSLQKGPAAEQIASLPVGAPIQDMSGDLHSFSDTAALIANLDLVITVDTAVAHLAGALGQRTWTLLPRASDWRWLRDREDSPWYPTMRLFRQPGFLDWTSVLQRVAEELRQFSHDFRNA